MYDFTLQGSYAFAVIFAMLWFPAMAVVIWYFLFWNREFGWTQLIRKWIRWYFIVGIPLVFLLEVIVYCVDRGAARIALPSAIFLTVEILIGFTGIVIFPTLSILLPIFVLDFWKSERKRPFLFFLVVLGFTGAAFLSSSFAQEKIASYQDPCYEVVEGKTGTYILKEGMVCVLRSSSASGTSTFATLEGADASSFEIVGYGYGKDAWRVYYGTDIMASLDPQTFHAVGDRYYADKTYVLYGRAAMPDADPATFVELPGNYYAKDARHAYYNETILEGADVKSFQALESAEYAWDKNHVYYADRQIEGADPKTFRFLKPVSFDGYTYDADQVFANGVWLKNLDAKTFERIGNSEYLRDSDSLYLYDQEVEGVDVQKFQVLPVLRESENKNESPFISTNGCGTDGKVVVCHGKIKEGEDPTIYFQLTEEQRKHLEDFSSWFSENMK